MAICAYCGKDEGKLTKEHLYPASLHRRLDSSNSKIFGQSNLFYLKRKQEYIKSELQVKDVCAECNNGVLSELDSYICEQWDAYFYKIVEHRERVMYNYNFNLLTRWLLKMCFNSARVHESDTKHLEVCRDYILGKSTQPEHTFFHLQLVYPTEFNEEDKKNALEISYPLNRDEPRLNRVGHLGYNTRKGYMRAIRAVHIQSYLFLIHLFPPSVSEYDRKSNLKDFSRAMPYAKKLDENGLCSILCDGLDAKKSFGSDFMNREADY